MLHYLDTAIGFAVIMLLLSLLVTSLVQTACAMLNLRGRNLRWGLTLLFQQMGLGEEEGKKLAVQVLGHDAIASPSTIGRRSAVAIRIEELYRVLKQFGREPNP